MIYFLPPSYPGKSSTKILDNSSLTVSLKSFLSSNLQVGQEFTPALKLLSRQLKQMLWAQGVVTGL